MAPDTRRVVQDIVVHKHIPIGYDCVGRCAADAERGTPTLLTVVLCAYGDCGGDIGAPAPAGDNGDTAAPLAHAVHRVVREQNVVAPRGPCIVCGWMCGSVNIYVNERVDKDTRVYSRRVRVRLVCSPIARASSTR